MKSHIIFCGIVLLAGCTTSGVIPTGPDSFMARAHSTLFTIDTGGGGAMANAIGLASKHCIELGKHHVISNTQIAPVGAGAQAIVNFECVDKSDRDYVRPKLSPMMPNNNSPTIIINN
jgi:hypothetical protein